MSKIRDRIKNRPEAVADALNHMRDNLMELARKALPVSNEGFGKYTSINPKGPYIEFRSAGGRDYNQDISKLTNTLLRYAKAMKVASDPQAEREEYYKKLYKLIAPAGGDSGLNLFAAYNAGRITVTELKKKWAETELSKTKKDDESEHKSYWQLYVLPGTPTAENMSKLRRQAQPIKGYYAGPVTRARAEALLRERMGGATWDSYAPGQLELRDIQANTGTWRASDVNGATMDIFDAPNSRQAYKYAEEHYPGVENVDPYPADDAMMPEPEAEPKPSRRTELAKRLAGRRPAWDWVGETPPGMPPTDARGNWRLMHFDRRENRSFTLYQFHAGSAEEAVGIKQRYCQATGLGRDEVKLDNVEQFRASAGTSSPAFQEPGRTQARDENGGVIWDIYRRSDDRSMHTFSTDNAEQASGYVRNWVLARQEAGEGNAAYEYSFRPVYAPETASARPESNNALRRNWEIYSGLDPEQRPLMQLNNLTAEEARERIQQIEASGEVRPGVLRLVSSANQ